MITFATLLWDPNELSEDFSVHYTEEWVERLYCGFERHTTRPFRFVVFTDRVRQFSANIIQMPIVNQPCNYASCIEPYKLNEPMILVGLDTIITGNIDDLVDYCITADIIALPLDPYRAPLACNGVALVPRGHDRVYAQHNGENDMEWMRQQPHALIDELFPGQVVSYKKQVRGKPLGDARIVYFHGKHKPHDLDEQWVKDEWGTPPLRPIGGYVQTLNNTAEAMLGQFAENLKRDLPFFADAQNREGSAILVGGGPSLAQTWGQIKYQQFRGNTVFALNGTHDWLIEKGVKPNYHILIDSREANVDFVKKPMPGVKYLVSAFCHPAIFDALAGYDVTIWMSDMEGVLPLVQHIQDKPVCLVGGGATVGMKAMYLAYLMGFTKFDFYGYDSSYADGQNHAYPQPLNDKETRIKVTANGREFECAPWMAKQAQEFQNQARKLLGLNCELSIHGDGLIPWIVKQWEEAV